MKKRMIGAAIGLALVSGLAGSGMAGNQQCGGASWYALHSMTASGEMMNPDAMTAAHRSLPFGTVVRVRNERNGRELDLRINDRGPFIKSRIIDVSRAAAAQLGFQRAGHTEVCIAQV